jgi:hypothetical protein
MKRDGGSSTAAVVIALMLSGCLVFISRASIRNDFFSMMQSIRLAAMQPMDACQSSSTFSIGEGLAQGVNGL